jgi:hypothetical protein
VNAQSGQAFSLSPPLLELAANPGERIDATIKITNVSAGALEMTVQANDFGSKNETGEPNIIFDDIEPTPYTLKGWINLPETFMLESKETRTVTVPIDVPQNAEPGGHYGVIRFTGTSAENGDQQVSLSASIGSLVLLRVAGDIQQSAAVESFYTASSDFAETSFFESSPVTFVTRIRNSGNIHIKPTGTVVVKDMFGNETATLRMNGDPAAEKDPPGSILPQSVRRFDTALSDKMLFGRYTATMQLQYGDGKTLERTTTFWVVPYKPILVGIVLLGIAIFGAVWGLKRYNAYIITKAGKHGPRK